MLYDRVLGIAGFIKEHPVLTGFLIMFVFQVLNLAFVMWSNLSKANLELELAIERVNVCKGHLHTWEACKSEYHLTKQWPIVRAFELTMQNIPSCFVDDCGALFSKFFGNPIFQLGTFFTIAAGVYGFVRKAANFFKRRNYERKFVDSWSPIDTIESRKDSIPIFSGRGLYLKEE